MSKRHQKYVTNGFYKFFEVSIVIINNNFLVLNFAISSMFIIVQLHAL